MPIDCPFCEAESWYGKDHMSACPQALVRRLDEKLTRYRRFLQRLGKLFPGAGLWIRDFLDQEKSK